MEPQHQPTSTSTININGQHQRSTSTVNINGGTYGVEIPRWAYGTTIGGQTRFGRVLTRRTVLAFRLLLQMVVLARDTLVARGFVAVDEGTGPAIGFAVHLLELVLVPISPAFFAPSLVGQILKQGRKRNIKVLSGYYFTHYTLEVLVWRGFLTWYCPATQASQDVLARLMEKPAAQSALHSLLWLSFWYRPTSQSSHDVLALLIWDPASQSDLQLICPLRFWYWPVVHKRQPVWPAWFWYLCRNIVRHRDIETFKWYSKRVKKKVCWFKLGLNVTTLYKHVWVDFDWYSM